MTDHPFSTWTQESDHAQSQRLHALSWDVERLRTSLSSQHRAASAMRSDLASLRGSIETRLTRLTEAFDAFVELSSLRDQLSLVAGPALVRQATRARLVALGTPSAPTGPVLDVAGAPVAPGYWLADALAVLGPDDDGAAQRAASIDLRRTATFLTVAGAASGRADLVARWSADALGTIDVARPVTRAQRAVWVAAAEGRLGADARATLLERLRAAVAAVPAATVQETVDAWAAHVQGDVRSPRPDGTGTLEVARVRRAAAALVALRELVESADPGTDAGAAADAAADARADAPADAGTDAGADVTAQADADATVAELVAVLRALVDEGAEEERDLMVRAAELEAVVTGAGAPGPAWDAPAGGLLTLLREDALGRRDQVGALVRDACGPWLAAVADRLLADATVPAPEDLEVSVGGVTLRARPRQTVVEGREEALRRITAPAHPLTRREKRVTVGCALAAVLLWVATAVDPSGLGWLYGTAAVAFSVAAGIRASRRATRSRADAERAERGAALVEREAQRLQARVEEVAQAFARSGADARDAHGRVVGLPAAPSSPTGTPAAPAAAPR